jgi:hypothetical protein
VLITEAGAFVMKMRRPRDPVVIVLTGSTACRIAVIRSSRM